MTSIAVTDTHYEVVASFDEYTGNYERELTQWVFGASAYMPGDDDEEPERPHAVAMIWAYDPEEAEGSLLMQVHDEYGLVFQDIGVDETYFTITWWLDESPTAKQWLDLERAIKSFKREKPSYLLEMPQPQLKDLSLYKSITTREHIR